MRKLSALLTVVMFLMHQQTAIGQRISVDQAKIVGDNFLRAKVSHVAGVLDKRKPSLPVLSANAELGAMSPILNSRDR